MNEQLSTSYYYIIARHYASYLVAKKPYGTASVVVRINIADVSIKCHRFDGGDDRVKRNSAAFSKLAHNVSGSVSGGNVPLGSSAEDVIRNGVSS